MSKQVRSNGYCFTVNNYDDYDIARVMSFFEEDINAKYLIIGFEESPRTKTFHMQCYIYYTNKVDFNKVMSKMTPYHVEPQKAKRNVEAYVYCMEDGDWIEYGDRPRQGHRTDLECIRHSIDNGTSLKDISKQYFSQWCQYRRSFDEYVNMHFSEEQTVLVSFDGLEVFELVPKIKSQFPNSYIFYDIAPWSEICKVVFSSKYSHVFVAYCSFYKPYKHLFSNIEDICH